MANDKKNTYVDVDIQKLAQAIINVSNTKNIIEPPNTRINYTIKNAVRNGATSISLFPRSNASTYIQKAVQTSHTTQYRNSLSRDWDCVGKDMWRAWSKLTGKVTDSAHV